MEKPVVSNVIGKDGSYVKLTYPSGRITTHELRAGSADFCVYEVDGSVFDTDVPNLMLEPLPPQSKSKKVMKTAKATTMKRPSTQTKKFRKAPQKTKVSEGESVDEEEVEEDEDESEGEESEERVHSVQRKPAASQVQEGQESRGSAVSEQAAQELPMFGGPANVEASDAEDRRA